MLKEIIKPILIKRLYSLPEEELIRHILSEWRINDIPNFMYKRFSVEKTIIDKRFVFKISPKSIASDKAVLFIHGGGGMLCPTVFHFHTAARLIKNTGAVLYMPFYPLAPENTLPEACRFLDKVYEKITSEYDSKKITVIGDSAGVSLGVSMCERSEKKPGGIVIISPGAGIDKCDNNMRELEKKDILMSLRAVDIIKKYWSGDASVSSSEYNSAYTDYTGFPPILLFYGTNEIFYPHINSIIDRIKQFNIPLEEHMGKELFHDWAIAGILPEAKEAQNRICEFIKNNKVFPN